MTVEEIKINGDKGQPISAYTARPSGPGPFPGVVLVHHLPGWSEIYCEFTRKFAHHGYIAICANLYERNGQGNPDDVAAKVRAEGGVPDAQVVGDTEAAVGNRSFVSHGMLLERPSKDRPRRLSEGGVWGMRP